jgi:hypothetical protein
LCRGRSPKSRVEVSCLSAVGLTINGAGTTRPTITTATVIAKLTATGRRLRRAKLGVRNKATVVLKSVKKAQTA